MRQVVIENPILNSPFQEPSRHWRFTETGISDDIVEGRRPSAYFMPIPPPKKGRGKQAEQLTLDSQWTQDRVQPNHEINRIRQAVADWRFQGRPGITAVTRRLLEHWTRPDRERRLFFCQVEALETAIYLAEVAARKGESGTWILNMLRSWSEEYNPGLLRVAFKMATGSGKTVVMAMLIAWQALNKAASRQDKRFTDAFLLVSPGITIRDRLRVLLPSDPDNYYRRMDLVPPEWLGDLGQARIVITNYHAFLPKETVKGAARLTKDLLASGRPDSPFLETPGAMVRRVCRGLGDRRGIMVLNDEAHHCYRHRLGGEEEKLTGDDREEAKEREEQARVWISGLEAIHRKIGVKTVYDLSATPFFLRGSGYKEGVLFPWVVSDFSLIDAIESGVVKIPRVPVADDSMTGPSPTYRDLWVRIKDDLPKKGRKTEKLAAEPHLPLELEGALHTLYRNYEKYYRAWEAQNQGDATPPVFIVVCNNTNVSKLVHDWVSGWEKPLREGTALVPGHLPLFSNVDADGRWLGRRVTILVDSQQLESGELSGEFKTLASAEIDTFKQEYRERFPGRDPDALTDADLLREVLNTVGKPGKLGEHIRCVVSVSMLTEGWDANTVTHILGVRAFGTQLLCEQVVGRGLRRMSYATNDEGFFAPEYAEVYGVPFSFIPCSGSQADPKPDRKPTRVRALPERAECEIRFPRLVGYRFDLPAERLRADFTASSRLALSTEDLPTRVESRGIVGETSIGTLDDLRAVREQTVAFHLAREVMRRWFRDPEGQERPWLFPQLLEIAKAWMADCVVCKDGAFPQMLLLSQLAKDAGDRIYRSVAHSTEGEKVLQPILRPYDVLGTTRFVDFDTVKPVWPTAPEKCHVSHVVGDTETWEQKMAQGLEEMDEVVHYVKNQGLGFAIPYTLEGRERSYLPDFLVRVRDGGEDLLNLIVEVSGERKKEKQAKVDTARDLWVPAVNNHGGFGRWAFVEVTDPWDGQNTIRAFLRGGVPA